MENLQGIADVVLEKQMTQDKILESAHNQTSNILSSLEVATLTVRTLQKPLLKLGTAAIWWPYVICPVTSLTLGSYGLQPSLTRNLALLGLGKKQEALVRIENWLMLSQASLPDFSCHLHAHHGAMKRRANFSGALLSIFPRKTGIHDT